MTHEYTDRQMTIHAQSLEWGSFRTPTATCINHEWGDRVSGNRGDTISLGGKDTANQSTGLKTDVDKNVTGSKRADKSGVVLSLRLTRQE